MRHEKFDVETIIGYMDGDMSSTTAEQLIASEFEGMTIEDLTEEEKEELTDRLDMCDGCGWTFDRQNLERYDDESPLMCWRCLEDYEPEEEE